MMKADLAIALIIIGIIISVTTLVIGFFMHRRGMRTRDLKLRVKAYVLWVVGVLLTGVLFFPALAYLYTEHLWFESVGYDNIFWQILKTRWGLLFKFFLVAVGFMGLNLFLGDRLCPISREFARWTRQRTNHFYYTMFIVIIFMAFLLAVPMMFLWDDFLRDDHRISSNIIEPVFEKELGFFLFSFAIHAQILKENTTQDSSGFSKSLIPSIYQLDIEAEGTGAINAYISGVQTGDIFGIHIENSNSADGDHYG